MRAGEVVAQDFNWAQQIDPIMIAVIKSRILAKKCPALISDFSQNAKIRPRIRRRGNPNEKLVLNYGDAAQPHGFRLDQVLTTSHPAKGGSLAAVAPLMPTHQELYALGVSSSIKMARMSNRGRGGGDGRLPSASQSNHFSQPPFLLCRCSRRLARQRAPRPRQAALGSEIKLHYESRC